MVQMKAPSPLDSAHPIGHQDKTGGNTFQFAGQSNKSFYATLKATQPGLALFSDKIRRTVALPISA